MKTSSCHIDEVRVRPTDYAILVSQSERNEPFALIIQKDAVLNPDLLLSSQGGTVHLDIDEGEVKQVRIKGLPVFDPHVGKPVKLGRVTGTQSRPAVAVHALA